MRPAEVAVNTGRPSKSDLVFEIVGENGGKIAGKDHDAASVVEALGK